MLCPYRGVLLVNVNRTISPPIVASGLSGLVVGVVLTLVVTGLTPHATSKALPSATILPPIPRVQPHLYKNVQRIVLRALAPAYPNPKISRLVNLELLPPESRADVGSKPRLHSVIITFRLNDHPLGKGWRLRAAKGDVFRVLKALYTSGLPVGSVHMDGEFPSGKSSEGPTYLAVTTFISLSRAAHIAWRKLDRTREDQVWRNLNRVYVNPRFG